MIGEIRHGAGKSLNIIMKKKIIFSLLVLGLVVAPFMAFAIDPSCASETGCNLVACDQGPFMGIICKIAQLINSAIPILISLAVLFFIYGVIQYAIAKDEEAKTGGRSAMIWGLIALLVIVSVWGLVALLKNTFYLGGSASPNTVNVPCLESMGFCCPQVPHTRGLPCCQKLSDPSKMEECSKPGTGNNQCDAPDQNCDGILNNG